MKGVARNPIGSLFYLLWDIILESSALWELSFCARDKITSCRQIYSKYLLTRYAPSCKQKNISLKIKNSGGGYQDIRDNGILRKYVTVNGNLAISRQNNLTQIFSKMLYGIRNTWKTRNFYKDLLRSIKPGFHWAIIAIKATNSNDFSL